MTETGQQAILATCTAGHRTPLPVGPLPKTIAIALAAFLDGSHPIYGGVPREGLLFNRCQVPRCHATITCTLVGYEEEDHD